MNQIDMTRRPTAAFGGVQQPGFNKHYSAAPQNDTDEQEMQQYNLNNIN